MIGEPLSQNQRAVLQAIEGSIDGETIHTTPGCIDLSDISLLPPATDHLAELLHRHRRGVEGLVAENGGSTLFARELARKLDLPVLGAYFPKDVNLPHGRWASEQQWTLFDLSDGRHRPTPVMIAGLYLSFAGYLLPTRQLNQDQLDVKHWATIFDKGFGARQALERRGTLVHVVLTHSAA